MSAARAPRPHAQFWAPVPQCSLDKPRPGCREVFKALAPCVGTKVSPTPTDGPFSAAQRQEGRHAQAAPLLQGRLMSGGGGGAGAGTYRVPQFVTETRTPQGFHSSVTPRGHPDTPPGYLVTAAPAAVLLTRKVLAPLRSRTRRDREHRTPTSVELRWK